MIHNDFISDMLVDTMKRELEYYMQNNVVSKGIASRKPVYSEVLLFVRRKRLYKRFVSTRLRLYRAFIKPLGVRGFSTKDKTESLDRKTVPFPVRQDY